MGTPQLKGLPPRPTPPWHIRENRREDGSSTYTIVNREGVEIYGLDLTHATHLLAELQRASGYYVPEVQPPERLWRCYECDMWIDDPDAACEHTAHGHRVLEVAQ